ncbi:MAG: hypothetical protein HUJ26_05260 [Planctomycetaceae bacterium]|nr:hypothetical protein [Planctomycetaceae bacterium]
MQKVEINLNPQPSSNQRIFGFGATVLLFLGTSAGLSSISLIFSLALEAIFSLTIRQLYHCFVSVVLVLHVLTWITIVICQKYSGRLLIDLGRSRLNSIHLMISAFWIILVIVGRNVESPPPLGILYDKNIFRPLMSYPEMVIALCLSGNFLFLFFFRTQIRERGLWLSFRLLDWESITKYEWRKIGDPAKNNFIELHLYANRLLPFLGRGILEVTEEQQEGLDEILQGYGVSEKHRN